MTYQTRCEGAALQGEENWTGLFDSKAENPIPDPKFRQELIKTGYLVQAAYKYLDVYEQQLLDQSGRSMVCPSLWSF